MPLIRVGIIGLSTTGVSQKPGAWGVLAHLPSLQTSPHYQIVALCNSSVESAEASIAHHGLAPKTRAYGAPEHLANDPNVDLVVLSVEVGKHYRLARPVLLAKKDMFIEWPIAASHAESAELPELASRGNVKTVVGLQARASPLVVKVKELIDGNSIGQVMSSTVVGCFGGIPADVWIQSATYYLDINSGGNALMIYFGHCQIGPLKKARLG